MLIQSVVIKRMCCVASCLRISVEIPPGPKEGYGYH